MGSAGPRPLNGLSPPWEGNRAKDQRLIVAYPHRTAMVVRTVVCHR